MSMNRSNPLLSAIVVGAALTLWVAMSADAATYAPIKRIGTASLESASAGAPSEGPVATFDVDFDAINRAIPRSGVSAARVPAAHVPTPSGNALSSSNAGFSGFNGLSQRDQVTAGTGIYAHTQVVLEPLVRIIMDRVLPPVVRPHRGKAIERRVNIQSAHH